MTRPVLLLPSMLKQYADRARKGDYEFHLKPGIYIWLVGSQTVTVFINGNSASGHVVMRTPLQHEAERLSLAAAMRCQAERRSRQGVRA
jgi:hypothetical protein